MTLERKGCESVLSCTVTSEGFNVRRPTYAELASEHARVSREAIRKRVTVRK